MEYNPLADLKAVVEEMTNDTGIDLRPVSLQEALYHEAQALYMMGATSDFVVSYLQGVRRMLLSQQDT